MAILIIDLDIETFLNFKRISNLTTDVTQIRKALSHSDFFEVSVLKIYSKAYDCMCLKLIILYLLDQLFFKVIGIHS